MRRTTKAEARAKAAIAARDGALKKVLNACKKYDVNTSIIVVKAAIKAFTEAAEELNQFPEVCDIYKEAADRLSTVLDNVQKSMKPEEQTAEQPAEATESTQSDRARSAYLNTCDECEAIEATGTREAVHEAKKLRTLAAEALAHFLRTRSPEWVEELETLQREAFEYSPDGLQDQRRGAEGIGYHPIN